MRTLFAAVIAGIFATTALGSGFGLYEPSTISHAMGGALVGKAMDASANFNNPATLSDLTNITVTLGFVTEHPRARMRVSDGSTANMDPGVFCLPHLMLAAPLPWDFTFGLGIMPEYGLGSAYDGGWALACNSTETTVQSITVNPNLSYSITDDWSIGAGLRFLWFDFEQYSRPFSGLPYPNKQQRLKGDNGMKDFGWQVGTRYRLLDNLAWGLVYKSETEVNVEGSSRCDSALAAKTNGDADTDLTLPQSIATGLNWDITDTWHLGGIFMWTQWSSLDTLDFHLGSTHKKITLDWKDTYRFAIAPSWDFARDWTWMCSYAYETDCCGSQDSTMLPPSKRHMLATGFVWRCWGGLELALDYGLIIMDGQRSDCTNTLTGRKYEYWATRGINHAAGFSVTYRF